MMRATTCCPSTLMSPTELELMVSLLELLVTLHVGPTMNQSGSPELSTNLSVPKLRHGKRPNVVQLEFGAPTPGFDTPVLGPERPSLVSLPMYQGCSGQGNRPGLPSPALVACRATQPTMACFA